MPWNDPTTAVIGGPVSWPKFVGIARMPEYAFWDVPLLIALFFHRYVLRVSIITDEFDGYLQLL
jgi:hypothetical protein